MTRCPPTTDADITDQDELAADPCKRCGCYQRTRFRCACGAVNELTCINCLAGGAICDRGPVLHEHRAPPPPPPRRRRRNYEIATWPT